MKQLSLFILTSGLLFGPRTILAEDGIAKLLERLASEPLDGSILYSLEGSPPDARVIPALKTAFENRQDKEEKQRIATTILVLGEKSDPHYDFLAGYARRAVEDMSPLFVKYDSAGHSVRGEFDPAFLLWCSANKKDPEAVAKMQVYDYSLDIIALARVQDPRSAGIFRRGLDSPSPLVVAYSVEGLGRLRDIEAIPAIEKSLQAMHPGDRVLAAAELVWYDAADAYQLLQRSIPDATLRNFWIDTISRERLGEARRASGRRVGSMK